MEILRNYDTPNPRKFRRPQGYHFPQGTTPVLKTEITPLETKVDISEGEAMEL